MIRFYSLSIQHSVRFSFAAIADAGFAALMACLLAVFVVSRDGGGRDVVGARSPARPAALFRLDKSLSILRAPSPAWPVPSGQVKPAPSVNTAETFSLLFVSAPQRHAQGARRVDSGCEILARSIGRRPRCVRVFTGAAAILGHSCPKAPTEDRL
jgi:hypothetical protein